MQSLFPRSSSGLPLVPIPPLVVALIGVAAAVAIAVLGTMRLAGSSDAAARERAEVLAASVAARLRSTPLEDRAKILGRAAQRSSTEYLLVDQDGQILENQSFSTPDAPEVVEMLVETTGVTTTPAGRAVFATRTLGPPVGHLSLIALVEAPSTPPGTLPMINAVAALTTLLLGLATAVVLSFARSAHGEVDRVRERIVALAGKETEPAGKPIAIATLDQVGVLTDAFNLLVTRFAAAERSYLADLEQAKLIDRERSAFLAGLSHELRTPLNAILGFAHVLETEVDGPLSPDARESIGVIRTSGEHLRQLIDDILDLSALETGQLQLTLRAVDVSQLAEQIMREARATAVGKPVRLAVGGETTLLANADKRRLRQAITNLVSNAIKFTREGSVTLHVQREGNLAAIIVSDTGPGIAPDDTNAIFLEYRQSGDSTSRRAGTGLGLAMAKRIAELHGGSIHVESKVGVGSRFTLLIPLYVGTQRFEIADPLSISELDPRGTLPSIPRASEVEIHVPEEWTREAGS